MNQGMILQAVLPTALFYICFYAEVSLWPRQMLAVWGSYGALGGIARLILLVGECPACAGWWFGLAAWFVNPSWQVTGVAAIDAILAGLWSVVSVPILWWLMSSALRAQQELVQATVVCPECHRDLASCRCVQELPPQ